MAGRLGYYTHSMYVADLFSRGLLGLLSWANMKHILLTFDSPVLAPPPPPHS